DVEDDLRRFVSGREPAGQAAMALYKIDTIAAQLEGKALDSVDVKVHVEKADDGLLEFLRRRLPAKFKTSSLAIDVENMDVQKGRVLVSDDFDIPSEVDDFWTRLRTRVVPAVKAARKRPAIAVQARLSEPPELRRRL